MSTTYDCFICTKHKTLSEFTGEVIDEVSGITITHFPFLKDEVAIKGRLIVEPKRHVEEISDLSEEEASALGRMIQSGVTLLKEKLGAEHVYVFRINDKVAHLHFHLIPRFKNTPKEYFGLKIVEWPGAKAVSLAEIKDITRILKSN